MADCVKEKDQILKELEEMEHQNGEDLSEVQRPSSQMQAEDATAKKLQKLLQKSGKRREQVGDSNSQEGKASDCSLTKSASSKLNHASRAKNVK